MLVEWARRFASRRGGRLRYRADMPSAAHLLRNHESLDWDATFTLDKQQVTAVEIKVVGRYADQHELSRAHRAHFFATTLERRTFWMAVSIAGRTAYCAALLERARKTWKLSVKPLDQYIAVLWDFAGSSDLEACEGNLSALRVDSPDQLNGLVPKTLVRPMFALVDAAWDVATTELGADIEDDSPATRIAVTFAEWTARRAKIPRPRTRTFARSRFKELDGWGKRHARTYYV